jgi:hypothetical protein
VWSSASPPRFPRLRRRPSWRGAHTMRGCVLGRKPACALASTSAPSIPARRLEPALPRRRDRTLGGQARSHDLIAAPKRFMRRDSPRARCGRCAAGQMGSPPCLE